MWFKNLIVYRFTQPFELSAEAFEEKLAEFAFTPCMSQDQTRYGWTAPLGKFSDALVHTVGRNFWFCARKEDKLVPAPVIKDAVQEKAERIAAEESRRVGSKEKQQLKDEVLLELLPRAFSRYSQTQAYIDAENGYLLIDAASFNKAEELMALLRKTLSTLPVLPLDTELLPATVMTQWLEHEAAQHGFEVLDEAELTEPGEDGAVVRFKRQQLAGSELQAHLEAGKRASKLLLSYADRISFLFAEDYTLKRLKFDDLVLDENSELDDEDPVARLDADFSLMTGEIAVLLPALLKALGGEKQQA